MERFYSTVARIGPTVTGGGGRASGQIGEIRDNEAEPIEKQGWGKYPDCP